MVAKIPSVYKSYFWDVNFSKIDTFTDKSFIIKRFLDRGNSKAIEWLLKTYSKSDIKKVVTTSGDISKVTANFWGDVLKIDKDKIICLQKPYSPIQFGLSS